MALKERTKEEKIQKIIAKNDAARVAEQNSYNNYTDSSGTAKTRYNAKNFLIQDDGTIVLQPEDPTGKVTRYGMIHELKQNKDGEWIGYVKDNNGTQKPQNLTAFVTDLKKQVKDATGQELKLDYIKGKPLKVSTADGKAIPKTIPLRQNYNTAQEAKRFRGLDNQSDAVRWLQSVYGIQNKTPQEAAALLDNPQVQQSLKEFYRLKAGKGFEQYADKLFERAKKDNFQFLKEEAFTGEVMTPHEVNKWIGEYDKLYKDAGVQSPIRPAYTYDSKTKQYMDPLNGKSAFDNSELYNQTVQSIAARRTAKEQGAQQQILPATGTSSLQDPRLLGMAGSEPGGSFGGYSRPGQQAASQPGFETSTIPVPGFGGSSSPSSSGSGGFSGPTTYRNPQTGAVQKAGLEGAIAGAQAGIVNKPGSSGSGKTTIWDTPPKLSVGSGAPGSTSGTGAGTGAVTGGFGAGLGAVIAGAQAGLPPKNTTPTTGTPGTGSQAPTYTEGMSWDEMLRQSLGGNQAIQALYEEFGPDFQRELALYMQDTGKNMERALEDFNKQFEWEKRSYSLFAPREQEQLATSLASRGALGSGRGLQYLSLMADQRQQEYIKTLTGLETNKDRSMQDYTEQAIRFQEQQQRGLDDAVVGEYNNRLNIQSDIFNKEYQDYDAYLTTQQEADLPAVSFQEWLTKPSADKLLGLKGVPTQESGPNRPTLTPPQYQTGPYSGPTNAVLSGAYQGLVAAKPGDATPPGAQTFGSPRLSPAGEPGGTATPPAGASPIPGYNVTPGTGQNSTIPQYYYNPMQSGQTTPQTPQTGTTTPGTQSPSTAIGPAIPKYSASDLQKQNAALFRPGENYLQQGNFTGSYTPGQLQYNYPTKRFANYAPAGYVQNKGFEDIWKIQNTPRPTFDHSVANKYPVYPGGSSSSSPSSSGGTMYTGGSANFDETTGTYKQPGIYPPPTRQTRPSSGQDQSILPSRPTRRSTAPSNYVNTRVY